tara:strand:+ start:76 stop:699 length:624 start_codon:yes stop_codon:yes gene_type:complete
MKQNYKAYLKYLLFFYVLCISKIAFSYENILILGDSLSAGYGIGIESSWTKLLDKKLKKERFLFNVINRSISGETTAGGIRRLPKLLSITKPKIVILELGANDGLRGLDLNQTKNNLSQMVNLIKKIGAKTLLIGIRIPPNYGQRYSKKFYNQFEEIASEKKIVLLPFMFKGFGKKKEYFLEDQIHPNKAAQKKILINVWDKLKTML